MRYEKTTFLKSCLPSNIQSVPENMSTCCIRNCNYAAKRSRDPPLSERLVKFVGGEVIVQPRKLWTNSYPIRLRGLIQQLIYFPDCRENIIRPYSCLRVSELRQKRPNLNTTSAMIEKHSVTTQTQSKYQRPSTLSLNHGPRLWHHRFEPSSDYRALRGAAFLQALWTTSI